MTLPRFLYCCFVWCLTPCSFWSYEYCKRLLASEDDDPQKVGLKVLLCGGIAGVATWASVFPLDMVKTRLQAQTIGVSPEDRSLLQSQPTQHTRQPLNAYQLARQAYREDGLRVFYRGLGVCSIRAFIVNAVQVRLVHLQ